jgi:hypothetical protein
VLGVPKPFEAPKRNAAAKHKQNGDSVTVHDAIGNHRRESMRLRTPLG